MHLAVLRQDVAIAPVVAPVSSRAPESGAMVRLLTCGSVDDGKSTLIGRLLWDSAAVAED
ncbi:MAG TPA: sulfate adenylyltransferase, partial [Methyloceanibacter sp.]|nr:sulfate adenylyltransferase [Methyloceanibacter sp.]